MSDVVVKIKNLKKSYGTFVAVDGISFEVKEGEIFGLLGPNGAGKTTLLECIEGLRTPDSGMIEVDGINPLANGKKLNNVLGVQLQSSGLPMTITVKEAIELFSAYHKINPNHDILTKMGLNEKLNKKFKDLSGGERRRLILALAIIHHPKVLILDEPTAALDVQSRVELHELMKSLRDSGTAILLATHDMAEAEKLCNRIAIILKGEVVTISTPKEITAAGSFMSKISVRTVGGSLKGTEGKFEEDYYIFNSDSPGVKVNEIINIINSKGDTLIDLRIERESLEEKFIEITSRGGC